MVPGSKSREALVAHYLAASVDWLQLNNTSVEQLRTPAERLLVWASVGCHLRCCGVPCKEPAHAGAGQSGAGRCGYDAWYAEAVIVNDMSIVCAGGLVDLHTRYRSVG
jgi:hypothetical protein